VPQQRDLHRDRDWRCGALRKHLAGTGARYTRANPPRRLLTKFACPNQSVAGKLEAAIKKLSAAEKRKLVGTTGAAARKRLLA
jgi:putative endonuclease